MPCEDYLVGGNSPTAGLTSPVFNDKFLCDNIMPEKDSLCLTQLDTFGMSFTEPFVSDQDDLDLSLAMEIIQEEGLEVGSLCEVLGSTDDNDDKDDIDDVAGTQFAEILSSPSSSGVYKLPQTNDQFVNAPTPNNNKITYSASTSQQNGENSINFIANNQSGPDHCLAKKDCGAQGDQLPVSNWAALHPTVTSLLTKRPVHPPLVTYSIIPESPVPAPVVENKTVTVTENSELEPESEKEEEIVVEDVSSDVEESECAIPLTALEVAQAPAVPVLKIKEESDDTFSDNSPVNPAAKFPQIVASLQANRQVLARFNSMLNVPIKEEPTEGPKEKTRKRKLSVTEEDIDSDSTEWNDSISSEDEGRLNKRRLNNRVAAQRCRQRKREYFQGLRKEIQDWECQNTRLRYEIHTLQKEMCMMSDILKNHNCQMTQQPGQPITSSVSGSTATQNTLRAAEGPKPETHEHHRSHKRKDRREKKRRHKKSKRRD